MPYKVGYNLKNFDNLEEFEKVVKNAGTEVGPLTLSIAQQIKSFEQLQDDINPILQKAIVNLGKDNMTSDIKFTLTIEF